MSVEIKSYRKERETEIMNGLRSGMAKACVLVQNAAKLNIQFHSMQTPWARTGQIASAVNNWITVEGAEIVGKVGIKDARKVIVGKSLEFGHTQKPGQYVAAIGKRLVASDVPPYPWLFPAVESNRGKIIDILKSSGAKGVSIT